MVRCTCAYTAELRAGSGPVPFARTAGVERIVPPIATGDADLTARSTNAKADLVIRHRATGAEYFLPTASTWAYEGNDAGLRFLLTTLATIDPRVAASGEPLVVGVWDLFVRISAHGWAAETRLGALRSSEVPAEVDATIFGEPVAVAQPYWTNKHDNLAVDIAPMTSRLAAKITAVPPVRATVERDRLCVPLPLHVVAAAPITVRLTRAGVAREVGGRVAAGGVLSVDLPADLERGARYRIEVAFREKYAKLGFALVMSDPPHLIGVPSKKSGARRSAAIRILGALKHRFVRRVTA